MFSHIFQFFQKQHYSPEKVFSDGFNSRELAKLLVNCLKRMWTMEASIGAFHFPEEAKESQIKVTESPEFISAKFDDEKKMKILTS